MIPIYSIIIDETKNQDGKGSSPLIWEMEEIRKEMLRHLYAAGPPPKNGATVSVGSGKCDAREGFHYLE